MNITPADVSDLVPICTLLDAASLPSADIDQVKLEGLLVARDRDNTLMGAVGLESRAPAGLLRSLVVAPAWRGSGLGKELVVAIEALARAGGISELFLLTTTAEAFFAPLGYAKVDRASAPAALKATAEFAALCPASAVCMSKRL